MGFRGLMCYNGYWSEKMNQSKNNNEQETQGHEYDEFFQDALTYMEALGIHNPEDDEANIQTVGLINHNSFMAAGNWILALLEGLAVHEQEELVSKLGVFGQGLIENINTQGSDDHHYILFIAHQTLDRVFFEKLFALGLILANYVDALVTKNNVDRNNGEDYATFYNESVMILIDFCMKRLMEDKTLDAYRKELDIDRFLNTIVHEISEQSRLQDLKLFHQEGKK